MYRNFWSSAAEYCQFPGKIEHGEVLLVGMIGKYEYKDYVKRIGHHKQIEFNCDKGYKRKGTYRT